MKPKTGKDLRYMLCLGLTILILFSLYFSLFIDWLSYNQAFEEYEILYGWRPEYERIQPWVKTVSLLFVQIWHWAIGLISIFVLWRFVWYPEVLLTPEFKELFKLPRRRKKK